MIELLGVGVRARRGDWCVRRVTATFPGGTLVAVVGDEPDAILDAVAGRVVPEEGRVWIDGIPLMRHTASRVRRRVADVDATRGLAESRSALVHAMRAAAKHPWLAWVPGVRRWRRAPALAALEALGLGDRVATKAAALSRAERIRLHCARAFTRPHTAVVVRAADGTLMPDDMAALLRTLRTAAQQRRSTVFVSLPDVAPAVGIADRVLGVADGGIAFDRSRSERDTTSIDSRTTTLA